MDLQSYIQLKQRAQGALTPKKVVEEQVETLEEETLDEIRLLAPGQSVKDYDAQKAKKDAEAAKNRDKYVPNRGAFDTLTKIQKDGAAKRSAEQAANKEAKADAMSGMSNWQKRRAARRSSSPAAIAKTNDKGQSVGNAKPATAPKTEPNTQPAAKAPAPKPQQTAQQKKDTATNAKYDQLRKSDPKAAAKFGMAASKAKFGDQTKPKTPNPLMKKMGLSKPTPSAGAQAAMKAAPMKSPMKPNSFGSASKTVSKLTNSVDMSEFDIILEHLMEQGFPQEEALIVMVNMSSEKQAQILEAAMHRDAKTGEVVDKAEIGKTYYPAQPKRKSSVALRKEKEAAEKKTQKEEVESIEENRRAARAAGGYKDDSKKQTDPSKDGFTGISGSIKEIMKQNKAIEAANKKKKTAKEEMDSLFAAYQSMLVSEEEADKLRDQRQERGGVDGNTRYDKAPKGSTNKFGSGKTALQKEMEKKYGKGKSAMDIVRAEIEKKHGKGAIMDKKKKD